MSKQLLKHTIFIRNNRLSFHFLFFAFIFITSCKVREKTTEKKISLDNKSARTLLAYLKQNEFRGEWLSAKFNTDVTIDSSKTSFGVSLRTRKDSAIWMSISPALGIEVARAIATKDSLKFINRLNSTYFIGDYNYISKLLHTELDFYMLQSLLVGNSVEFYEEDEKLRSAIDDHKYLLSTIRKRRLKKVIERNKELKDPVQSIWLEPGTYKIARILFNDFGANRTFDAKFEHFEKIDSLYFPHKISFDIKAEKKISMSLEYSKITINKPLTFPFSIPEKYDPIIYKER